MSKKFKCQHSTTRISDFFKKPTETNVRNFSSIAAYFMYEAPNIDCAHSVGRITDETAKKVFREMLSSADMNGKYKVLEKIRDESWNEYNLVGDKICMQCSRMTYSRLKKEDELTALLRHVRNAFAHGLIYVKKFGKEKYAYLMLEDMDVKKKKTARIVLSFEQLERWKAILENEKAVGE